MSSRNPVHPAVVTPDHAPMLKTLAADPWDAPYFGAPVYFSYRPVPVTGSTAGKADVPARASAEQAQWTHFPLFGGPIFDAFPPFAPAPSSHLSTSGAPLSTGPALDTLHPRFFGSPVYLTYEPDLAGFRREPELAPAPASAQTRVDAFAPQASVPARNAQAHQVNKRRGGWLTRVFWRHR